MRLEAEGEGVGKSVGYMTAKLRDIVGMRIRVRVWVA